MLDSPIEHHCCHVTPLSNKNLQEAVCRVMEEKLKDVKINVNKVTMDTFVQTSITINAQKKDANLTY